MATLPKLKKIQSSSDELNRIQDSLIAGMNPVLNSVIVNGNLVKSVNLDRSKDNIVNHGLGRNYIGWIITRRYNSVGFTDVFESATQNNSPDKFLLLNTLSDLTCDLWIF
jgi:hypothetical protein